MYKLSVPLYIPTMTDENLHIYLDQVKRCKVDRVFLCGVGEVFQKDCMVYTQGDRIKKLIQIFKENGYEVGIWFNGFGHGSALAHDTEEETAVDFTYIRGVDGKGDRYGLCPLDEKFFDAYKQGAEAFARLNPDIIMIDDDLRLNNRNYYMGCFCKYHLEAYYQMIGEEIPVAELEKKIFSGGKNKYRTAYMQLSAKTLLDFAKKLRAAVDAINPNIRMGACAVLENWDYCGTDMIELSKAFAGNTKPFVRTIGAAYWPDKLSNVIEDTRLQAKWCRDNDIEVFSEGDVYPRPRYRCSSKRVELYDMALRIDGGCDGILKYMFDYNTGPLYETGYIDRHIKNEGLRDELQSIFAGKKPVGVHSFNVMHKIENWDLPEQPEPKIALRLIAAYKNVSQNILALNSIPSTVEKGEYPMLLSGENAKYVTEEDLANGAILDAPAAKILTDRGIDVGFVSCEDANYSSEYFIAPNEVINGIQNCGVKKLVCSEKATVLSTYLPDNTPASYLYENEKGLRVCVIAADFYRLSFCPCFYNNYHRQQQLFEAIEYIGRKKFPAVCLKNPCLYTMASKDEEAMSVALFNIFDDEILKPEIRLDREYSSIKFVNCTGELVGDKVYLSELAPYGVAAFEVK